MSEGYDIVAKTIGIISNIVLLSLNSILDESIIIVSYVILGHLGQGFLASFILGHAVYRVCYSMILNVLSKGHISVSDIKPSSSVDASPRSTSDNIGVINANASRITYISILFAVGMCTLTSIFFISCSAIFPYIPNIKPKIAHKASEYLIMVIPALWCSILSNLISTFMSNTSDATYITATIKPTINAIGLIINIVLSYYMVFAAGLGYIGCSISISTSHAIMLLLWIFACSKLSESLYHELCSYLSYRRNFIQKLPTINMPQLRKKSQVIPIQFDDEEVEMTLLVEKENDTTSKMNTKTSSVDEMVTSPNPAAYLSRHNSIKASSSSSRLQLARFLASGFIRVMLSSSEVWMEAISTLLIICLGSIALDAHALLIIITRLSYHILSSAVATIGCHELVHDHIYVPGNQGAAVKKLSYLSIILIVIALCFHALCGILMYIFSSHLGYIFTSDEDIAYRISQLILLAAGYQVAYGINRMSDSILAAIGKKTTSTMLNILTIWLIGLPASIVLCFVVRPTLELQGYWVGLMIGIMLAAASKAFIILTMNWKKYNRKRSQQQPNKMSYKNPMLHGPSESVWIEFMDEDDN